MRHEPLLAGGAVGIAVIAVLVLALVPGAVSDPRTDDREELRPGHVGFEEVTVTTAEITGSTVTLTVDARLSHSRGLSENVTVAFRATDRDTGMIETTDEHELGNLSETREIPVVANLTVPREGGYDVEVVVYRDGERAVTGSTRVSNLAALSPPRAETPVEFHRFGPIGDRDAPPTVQYSIAETEDGRATLDVSVYLTNTGDLPEDGLELTVAARQAESNIVADDVRVDVGAIEPGVTATTSVELTVPDGYNYYLDAVLWKDGVIVDDTRAAANLAPGEPLTVNETDDERRLQVDEFETEDERRSTPAPTAEDAAQPDAPEDAPGFGVLGALTAVLVATLLGRRLR